MKTGKLFDIISRGRKARRGDLLAIIDDRGHLDIVKPGKDGEHYVAIPTLDDYSADDWILIPEHPAVWYLAHPVWNGGRCACATGPHRDPKADTTPAEIVACNVARAKRWIRWLWCVTEVAVIAPWLAHVELLDDRNPAHRERGLRDNTATAARCSGVMYAGGEISEGMKREGAACVVAGGREFDLTRFGSEPPEVWGDRDADRKWLVASTRGELDLFRRLRSLHTDA